MKPNNIPVHAPLYPSDLIYGGDDAKVVSVLVEVDEARVRDLLAETPFEFVSAHAWLEITALDEPHAIERFIGGGVVIPARFGDTLGGYYAFCYLDTDDGLALGREPFGYPKKFTRGHLQITGRAATASVLRKDAGLELSVVTEAGNRDVPDVPRYPHLLLQVLPSAETADILLKRVILRDTGAVSDMNISFGEGAFALPKTEADSELAWLEGARPVVGMVARGAFRSALGKVLATVQVGSELTRDLKR